jgi:Flp pilus assembly protein TadG
MEHQPPARAGAARRRRRTRGQALVEFALVLPIFMLLVTGMLDFGFALYSRMTVINAAREGARAAVTAADKTLIPVLVPSAVNGAANGLTPLGISAACVAIATTPPPCRFTSSGPGTLAKPGDAVKVSVTYTYQTFFPLFFGATFDLGTNVQMVLE